MPCITKAAVVWDHQKMRRLLGIEKLALHGVFPNEAAVRACNDQFLAYMASQSFCVPTVLEVLLATFLELARKASTMGIRTCFII